MPAENKYTILVTGAEGQLASEIKRLSHDYESFIFFFENKETLPIDSKEKIASYFENRQIDFCINCAAYTAVDKAESEKEKAFLINGTAVGELAAICKAHKTKFIHISTDYVYDGSAKEPLKETDAVGPLNVYGWSKLRGEELALTMNPGSLILRTSWVYSSFGNNFVKTMMRLLIEKRELNIVADQIGSPTYAADLAKVIMHCIEQILEGKDISGILNYCNYGITSWFQFAQYIQERIGSNCVLYPVASSSYPTAAMRPLYSVLDTSKIQSILKIEIPFWKQSVAKCIDLIIKSR